MIPQRRGSSLRNQQTSTLTSTNLVMPRNRIPPETGLRMVTRAKNADTHPGMVVRDALRAQRPKEVIQNEKQEKKAKKDAADQAKANAKAGVHAAAQLEAEDAHAAAMEDKWVPRHRQPGRGMFSIAPE